MRPCAVDTELLGHVYCRMYEKKILSPYWIWPFHIQFYLLVWFNEFFYSYHIFNCSAIDFYKCIQTYLCLYAFVFHSRPNAPLRGICMWTQRHAKSRCSICSLHVLFTKTMFQLKRFSYYCRKQQHKFTSNMIRIMHYKCYNC